MRIIQDKILAELGTLGQIYSTKNNENTIDVSALKNSAYFLQITDEQTKESIVKIIIVAR
jgi:hypothetical protein